MNISPASFYAGTNTSFSTAKPSLEGFIFDASFVISFNFVSILFCDYEHSKTFTIVFFQMLVVHFMCPPDTPDVNIVTTCEKPYSLVMLTQAAVTHGVRLQLDPVPLEPQGEGVMMSKDKLEALIRVLEPFGIKELVQSGMVAIGRGARSITDRSLRAIERSA